MVFKVGEIIAERYEIVHKIGFGGMAIVYKATDLKLDRQVTFKVMREEYAQDDDFIHRFHKEARAAASVTHQNLVNIYDVGSCGLTHYIVMEYIDGYTLKELITKKAPFTNDETLGVAIQIAAALEHAHNNNIIHRDIKPQNILITSDGTVKVTDFGIARVTSDATQTITSRTMGSVHYFSPEQARGGYTDGKSDIYSLGIVMFEMATGRIPFDDETPVAIALKHINEPLPDILSINANASPSLRKIIEKATEKQTSKRYQTMEAMGNDCKRAITNSTGDFVLTGDAEDGQHTETISFSDDEMAILKQEARAIFFNEDLKKYGDEPDDSDFEPDYRDEAAYEYDGGEGGGGFENDGYGEGGGYGEGEPDGEYPERREANGVKKSSEAKIIAAAIATSIIIIALACAVVIRVFLNPAAPPEAVMVEIPNVIGQSVEDARRQYAGGEFQIVIDAWEFSDTYERGVIIDQKTQEGSFVAQNSVLRVIVSEGSDKIAVAQFVGLSLDELNAMYNDDGQKQPLSVEIKEIYDDDVSKFGCIVKQEPPFGELVTPDTIITAYVSVGPEPKTVEVPKLIGQTEQGAKDKLAELGLEAGSVGKSYSDTVEKGLVVSQSVPEGRSLPSGYVVGFNISLGPRPAESAAPEAPKAPEAPPPKTALRVLMPAYIPEGLETVEYRVVRLDKNDVPTVETSGSLPASAFPLSIELKGSGVNRYIFSVYYDDSWKMQDSWEIDFDA